MSLYGQTRSKPRSSKSDPPSSSTLAFTTALSSLISKDNTKSSTRGGRPRPSKSTKSDIFTRHNKGAQKRAAADLRDDGNNHAFLQVHQRSQDIGGAVDAATLHRSKRRMEEKARMYEDMKSGMYLAGESDDDDDDDEAKKNRPGRGDEYLARLRRKEREGLVDFDRKWADAERAKGSEDSGSEGESSGEDDDDDEAASIISYEDELGRTRRGTRKDAVRAAALKAQDSSSGTRGGEEKERWRPNRPENLIYGATVQSEAFNPGTATASQMAYLATRRDRSPTPEETHYDADAEVRNRGTGFYAFSKDEEVRRKQMEELLSARQETQRERDARRERRAERKRIKDDRRKEVEKLRAKRRAELFLVGLADVGVSG